MTALLLAAFLAQDWQPRSGGATFINPTTLEEKSPQELLTHALARREAKELEESISILQVLVRFAAEGSIRETAHFERAQTYFASGLFYEAYDDYEKYILRYPQSSRATQAKEREMESAFQLARGGHKEKVLGIPLVSSSKAGVEALKDALRRYPREDFSAGYYQKLGKFFYERSDWDHAAEQFSLVLEQYADAPDAVFALYMLGLTSENRFDAIDYDVKPLKDARRYYERFLEEADRMRKLPAPAKEWVDGLLEAVQERLGVVYRHLLEKTDQTARYYDWKNLPWSAAIYYRAILKDDATFHRVLPKFPETDAVKRAKRRIPEIQAELQAEIEESRNAPRK